ncbi:unnamed protein product [Notodromas monacha]|uniref:Sorting nexin-27 n=1 Tax=Notodromas monacha TaxID=399045 RepID=A0A7R9BEZ5_9CRUS|nr:unnamed protein product [Notodromas monacha]CAG0912888.1 unnamed protein product [Notodromas monacha]
MAKNTLSSAFRKLDVDQYDAEKYIEEDAAEPQSPPVGPDEREINSLVAQNKCVDALLNILQNSPCGAKNQMVRDSALNLMLKVMTSIKSSSVEEAVNSVPKHQGFLVTTRRDALSFLPPSISNNFKWIIAPVMDDTQPRVVTIHKNENGFGFNVRGQVSEGGQLKSINGELYGPMQHVSAVLEGGAAEKAGVRKGDRILEVNGTVVEGFTHRQVVDLIRAGGDDLTLTVISVSEEEADRLEPLEDSNGDLTIYDYSDKRSLPITIPDYCSVVGLGNEKFVVYNIYMAGRHLCSRRYSEFCSLHQALKREFYDFSFPKLPGKWLFTLNEQQLDARRRGLEHYLEKICAVRVIADSDIVQEFFTDNKLEGPSVGPVINVDIKVLLPDQKVVCLSVKKTSTADEVYQSVLTKINMDPETARFFALFELIEYCFERKLQANEFPHAIYIQNYTTATATCLALRKWAFLPEVESRLLGDTQAVSYIYWQAVDDVNRGHVKAGNKLYELKAVQDPGKALDYLKLVMELPGYGDVRFPHCACDARKTGHVIPIVNGKIFRLEACTIDGEVEPQMIEFAWNTILQWEIDEKNFSFNFLYDRTPKPPRWVKIFGAFNIYLWECFQRVQEELDWLRNDSNIERHSTP